MMMMMMMKETIIKEPNLILLNPIYIYIVTISLEFRQSEQI